MRPTSTEALSAVISIVSIMQKHAALFSLSLNSQHTSCKDVAPPNSNARLSSRGFRSDVKENPQSAQSTIFQNYSPDFRPGSTLQDESRSARRFFLSAAASIASVNWTSTFRSGVRRRPTNYARQQRQTSNGVPQNHSHPHEARRRAAA